MPLKKPFYHAFLQRFRHDPAASARKEGRLGILFVVVFCSLMIIADVREINIAGWILVILMGLVAVALVVGLVGVILGRLRR